MANVGPVIAASVIRPVTGLLLAGLLAGCATGSPSLNGERPDHMILVSIAAQPDTAEILPPGSAENDPPLGRGSYRFAMDLHWGRGWILKKWHELEVNSRALPCTATYDAETTAWTLSLQYEVRAPGYEPQVFSEKIASFVKPAELDWDRITGIPERVSLRAALRPIPYAPVIAPVRVGHSHFIIMAENPADQTLASVNVFIETVPADAEVLMNGKPAPRTGFVQENGPYHFVVKSPGYAPREFDVGANPGADIRQHIELERATP